MFLGPSLQNDNGSQNSGKRLTYIYQFIIKPFINYTNGQSEEEVHRVRGDKVMRVGVSVPVELGCATLLACGFVHQSETPNPFA